VSTPTPISTILEEAGRWRWPISARSYDTAVVRTAEKQAITKLGVDNLRQPARHDPAAPQWQVIRRLMRPLNDVSAALDGPLTPHRLRANHDAVAVLLLRCAESGRSFWHWTEGEWVALLGGDQHGFRATLSTDAAGIRS
jgi:hypothetical protein